VGVENRDYNRGGGGEDYLSNPASILGFSVPFGTWLGARVRLHFWLLLSLGFAVASVARGASDALIAIYIVLLFISLMLHDFGHRLAAQSVGGRHDEFMLWPAGGLNFPEVPPGAWPRFAGYGTGVAVNLVVVLAAQAGLYATRGMLVPLPWNPLTALSSSEFPATAGLDSRSFLPVLLYCAILINWGLVLINLLPYYWFDGGYLLDAILTPFLGTFRAVNVACIIGMVLAVPMCAIALVQQQFIGLIVWALLFSSSYSRRRQLHAEGAGALDAAIAASAQDGGRPSKRNWQRAGWAQAAAKRAAKVRKEQRRIDAILEKVGAKGMHSLSWWEKRTLQKATERQRREEAKSE
jgi:stage IV sporulation protein FB